MLEDMHLSSLSLSSLLHLSSVSVTLSQLHYSEEVTRRQSATLEWHSLRQERMLHISTTFQVTLIQTKQKTYLKASSEEHYKLHMNR